MQYLSRMGLPNPPAHAGIEHHYGSLIEPFKGPVNGTVWARVLQGLQ